MPKSPWRLRSGVSLVWSTPKTLRGSSRELHTATSSGVHIMWSPLQYTILWRVALRDKISGSNIKTIFNRRLLPDILSLSDVYCSGDHIIWLLVVCFGDTVTPSSRWSHSRNRLIIGLPYLQSNWYRCSMNEVMNEVKSKGMLQRWRPRESITCYLSRIISSDRS